MLKISKKKLRVGVFLIMFLTLTTITGIANTFINHYELQLKKEYIAELEEDNENLVIENASQKQYINDLQEKLDD